VLIVTPSDLSSASAVPGPASEFAWAHSPDGQQVGDHGVCAASLMPRDEDVVLVLPASALSWHRVSVPKVAPAKLRAVLEGLLEDRVLSDVAGLHLALEPGGKPGQTLWVAATDSEPLRAWLRVLDTSGRPVSRIVPSLWPLKRPQGSDLGSSRSRLFDEDVPEPLHWAHAEGEQAWLDSASVHGVSRLPLREGSDAQAAIAGLGSPDGLPDNGIWLADPAVAGLAERVLARRFQLVSFPAWLVRCAQGDWNLAQFDLSLSVAARRRQRLRRQWQQFRKAPAWRPARWGLAALVAANLVGLNTAAWHERRLLDQQRQAIEQTLRQTFPGVPVVLDAPVQMRRELVRLQQASGQPSRADLEVLLAALDQAAGDAPIGATRLQFRAGALQLSGWQAPPERVQAIAQGLSSSGWRARVEGEQLTLEAAQP
jgi:general secretion pathway protein L